MYTSRTNPTNPTLPHSGGGGGTRSCRVTTAGLLITDYENHPLLPPGSLTRHARRHSPLQSCELLVEASSTNQRDTADSKSEKVPPSIEGLFSIQS